MSAQTIEAAIRFPDGEIRERLCVGQRRGFGLLEPAGDGWTLCIPFGAKASCEGVAVDLRALTIDASGERHFPYAFGHSASVDMAGVRFEVGAT
ncbi:MAG TPA: hypothetical protein ENK57_26190 [Polyangiaceae bacterium]|nr:hypothetical protein [Polyangiaceae bacterium]